MTEYLVHLCGHFGFSVELVRTDDLGFAREIVEIVNKVCCSCVNEFWVNIEELQY